MAVLKISISEEDAASIISAMRQSPGGVSVNIEVCDWGPLLQGEILTVDFPDIPEGVAD